MLVDDAQAIANAELKRGHEPRSRTPVDRRAFASTTFRRAASSSAAGLSFSRLAGWCVSRRARRLGSLERDFKLLPTLRRATRRHRKRQAVLWPGGKGRAHCALARAPQQTVHKAHVRETDHREHCSAALPGSQRGRQAGRACALGLLAWAQAPRASRRGLGAALALRCAGSWRGLVPMLRSETAANCTTAGVASLRLQKRTPPERPRRSHAGRRRHTCADSRVLRWLRLATHGSPLSHDTPRKPVARGTAAAQKGPSSCARLGRGSVRIPSTMISGMKPQWKAVCEARPSERTQHCCQAARSAGQNDATRLAVLHHKVADPRKSPRHLALESGRSCGLGGGCGSAGRQRWLSARKLCPCGLGSREAQAAVCRLAAWTHRGRRGAARAAAQSGVSRASVVRTHVFASRTTLSPFPSAASAQPCCPPP